MVAQFKKNNPSIEVNDDISSVKQPKTARPNIDHLIKRILVERRRGKRNTLILGTVFFTIILILYIFNTN